MAPAHVFSSAPRVINTRQPRAAAQPRPAVKPAAPRGGRAAAPAGAAKRGGRSGNGRTPKPKTTLDQLDQEMADYYAVGTADPATAAPAANAGDIGMDDTELVGTP